MTIFTNYSRKNDNVLIKNRSQKVDNQIYPKILSETSFLPLLFKHNKLFTMEYKGLLNNFRSQIQKFNLEYIDRDITAIQSNIQTKLNTINSFDNEAFKKYGDKMFKDIEESFSNDFKTANEKINNLIAKNKNQTYETYHKNNINIKIISFETHIQFSVFITITHSNTNE